VGVGILLMMAFDPSLYRRMSLDETGRGMVIKLAGVLLADVKMCVPGLHFSLVKEHTGEEVRSKGIVSNKDNMTIDTLSLRTDKSSAHL
jgi:hypothetical protein